MSTKRKPFVSSNFVMFAFFSTWTLPVVSANNAVKFSLIRFKLTPAVETEKLFHFLWLDSKCSNGNVVAELGVSYTEGVTQTLRKRGLLLASSTGRSFRARCGYPSSRRLHRCLWDSSLTTWFIIFILYDMRPQWNDPANSFTKQAFFKTLELYLIAAVMLSLFLWK